MFKQDEKKSAQAVAWLLRKAEGRENYTKLLKILYLVDREALLETGVPVAGTRFCNMDNGPLASDVYNYIKGDSAHPYWDSHIVREGYFIHLSADPGDDDLSDHDIGLLDKYWEIYKGCSFSEMIDIVHMLPEWEPQHGSSTLLDEGEIMRAAGVPDEVVIQVVDRNTRVFVAESHLTR